MTISGKSYPVIAYKPQAAWHAQCNIVLQENADMFIMSIGFIVVFTNLAALALGAAIVVE